MKISDSDKPKLIVLICLVVLILVFGVYRMMGAMKTPAPVAPSPEKSGTSAAVDAQLETVEPPAPMVIMAKARDPFEPQVIPSTEADKSKIIINPDMKLPLFGGGNLNQLPPIRVNPSGNQVVVIPDALPNFILMGVVTGNRNLAVIKGEGTTRYMVYEGQYIEGKYLVKSISRTSVSIQYRDRITVLKLGGKDAVQN